jgi:hypothetical protein
MIVAIAAASAFFIIRSRSLDSPAKMLACLPQEGATLVYIDVDALRNSGILSLIAGSKAAEDADYRKFVDNTGFDYERDLHRLAAAFAGGNSYFIVDGAFDWTKLHSYAKTQGGTCGSALCTVPSATPGRKVSFYRLRGPTMALAFSLNPYAAFDIAERPLHGETPGNDPRPIWISVPGAVLRSAHDLPAGAQSFASPLASAEKVVFFVAPRAGGLELNLEVACTSVTAASDLVTKLESATNLLRKMISLEHLQANTDDLSGLLTAGTFRREDRYVYGSWPLSSRLIQNLLGGTAK